MTMVPSTHIILVVHLMLPFVGCTDGNLLLFNGSQPSVSLLEGRVEICYNNTYGTVCDDFWDELDSQVVCQQLFNTSLAVPVRGGLYGAGSGDILLDNVVCVGSEESLLQCGSSGLFQHNCAHSEDAGVRCGGL